ncbi:hypothetical protein ACWGLP_13795 [Streptomyces lydicus]
MCALVVLALTGARHSPGGGCGHSSSSSSSGGYRSSGGYTGSAATYNGTVQFTDASGGYVGTAQISSVQVAAGQTRPATVSGTFIKNPNGGPTSGRCKLGQVWKANS